METYLDCDDAWLIALTRERRKERARRKAKEIRRRDYFRAAHERLSFPEIPRPILDPIECAWREREERYHYPVQRAWKVSQWDAGNRHCGYCERRMILEINQPRSCTVDHRRARAFGGKDEPENWIMACGECNWRKGTMSEVNFRRLLASENTPRAKKLA